MQQIQGHDASAYMLPSTAQEHSLDSPWVGCTNVIIVGDQVDEQARLLKLSKGGPEVRLQRCCIWDGQDGLMNLDLGDTERLELAQNLRVGRKKALDELSALDALLLGKANQGVGTYDSTTLDIHNFLPHTEGLKLAIQVCDDAYRFSICDGTSM